MLVPPKLDERVADHAVVARGRRRQRTRAAAERKCFTEAVARESERAEAARRDQVVRRQRKRAAQHAIRLRVVGGVAGFPRALLVGQPEQIEAVDIAWLRPKRVLQLKHERGRVRGESGCEPIIRHGRAGGDGGGVRTVENAAEEESDGGEHRHRRSDQQPWAHGFC